MSTKAVVFDCDGMIVRSERVSDHLIAHYGAPESEVANFFRTAFQRCLVGEADLREELTKVMRTWNWTGSVDELLELWFAPERNQIDERFKPLIDSLKSRGIRVCLATNNEKHRMQDLLSRRGLGEWFDEVFAAYSIASKKPESRFYTSLIERIGVEPSAILFFDDHEKNVQAARAAGLRAERFSTFENFAGIVATL